MIWNTNQDIIIIPGDRVHRILAEHEKVLEGRNQWIAPLSLLFSIVITLVSATFKDFIVPASTWQAMFMMSAVLSLVWLLTTLPRAFRRGGTDEIIKAMKQEGITANQTSHVAHQTGVEVVKATFPSRRR